MKKYNRSAWIAGGAFVILLIFGVSWFAWASPNLSEAKQFQEDIETAEDQNHRHRIRLAQLQAQYENLDEYRADLQTLREQIPTTHEITELSRQLEAVATDNDVFVISIHPDLPLLLDPADLLPPEEPEDEAAENDSDSDSDSDSDADSDSDDSDAEDTPAPVPNVTVPEGFTAVPISMTILGSYGDVSTFLNTVQEPENRLLFISNLSVQVQDEAEESGDTPAIAAGDVEVNLQGFAYLLPDGRPVLPGADPDAEEGAQEEAEQTPADLPNSNRNPFEK